MALRNRARSTRLLVVTLVSVSLVTITVDYRQGEEGPLAEMGSAALTVISPLQEAVSKVTHPIGNFFSTLFRLPSIRRENQELRDQVAALEQEVATTRADLDRLAALEALLGLQASLGRKTETTAAQVIANGVSNFEWSITIDKGSSDGIVEDMPVVANAGLVGHIVRVGPSSSVVQLIIDPDSFVAGRLDVSRGMGLLSGEGGSDLRMSLVEATVEVAPGERVVTAGYRIPGDVQSLYPPNILIGTVSRVLPQESALENLVTVRPAVDFSTLDLVLVVLSSDGGE
ncbi:MAG TPA: rod shape-determining protein MreC [Actinomycetota bacterium]|nr:rod shape-determining protein MreC [Actinomycetota bacterium]